MSPFVGLAGMGGRSSFGSGSRIISANYFGDGSNGALNTSGNVTYTVPNKNGSYDGDYVVKQYTDLTVNSGHTITTDQPCKGLMIFVDGNCIINGTISMSRRGAASNPDSVVNTDGIRFPVLTADGTATLSAADFAGCGSSVIDVVANQGEIVGNGHIIQIPKRGANGGARVTGGISQNSSGNTGFAGSAAVTNSIYNVYLGGGGSGGRYSDTNSCGSSTGGYGGRGGNATCFSGGTGGGGKMSGNSPSDSDASDGDDNGGAGGFGGNGHCGGVHTVTGGCGNPGGTDQYGSTSQSGGGGRNSVGEKNAGTGGVVWLIVRGNLTVNGEITVAGSSQDTSGRTTGGVYGAGGGSGAGAVIVLYGGTYNLNGSITTTGGTGFTSVNAGAGATGGSGAYLAKQILVQ
jgi:hypothetical protein